MTINEINNKFYYGIMDLANNGLQGKKLVIAMYKMIADLRIKYNSWVVEFVLKDNESIISKIKNFQKENNHV